MQVICEKDKLSKILNLVNKAVSSKSIIPILSNILFLANTDGLTLIGTDLEISIEAKVPDAQIVEIGKVTLPAKLLTDIVNKLPSPPKDINDIELEKYKVKFNLNEEQNTMHISYHKSDYYLQVLPVEDFPSLPKINADKVKKFKREVLANAIKQTRFSTSTEVSKGILNGIHINIRQDKIEILSTDGYRLSMKTWEDENKPLEDCLAVTIPYKSMTELEKILTLSDEEVVEFAVSSNHAMFKLGDKVFFSRILDGQYPDYHKIISKNYEYEIILDKSEFYGAIERASLIASEQTNVVKLEILPQNKEIHIKADTPDLGQGIEVIDIECNTELKPININFNAKFILDALRHIEGEKVIFNLNDELKPVLLYNSEDKVYTDTYPSYLCMIMPIRSNI